MFSESTCTKFNSQAAIRRTDLSFCAAKDYTCSYPRRLRLRPIKYAMSTMSMSPPSAAPTMIGTRLLTARSSSHSVTATQQITTLDNVSDKPTWISHRSCIQLRTLPTLSTLLSQFSKLPITKYYTRHTTANAGHENDRQYHYSGKCKTRKMTYKTAGWKIMQKLKIDLLNVKLCQSPLKLYTFNFVNSTHRDLILHICLT